MPGTKGPKTHNQARRYCCAACGRGGAELAVSNALERLINKYAYSMYNVLVELYPTGYFFLSMSYLYKCKNGDDSGQEVNPLLRKEWEKFHLEKTKVPRSLAECKDCSCPMCKCAHFNPVSVLSIIP